MEELEVFRALVIVCPLIFLGGIVDAIVGGGGLITIPAYLLAGLSPHGATATNKCSSSCGSLLSTIRFFRQGTFISQASWWGRRPPWEAPGSERG